jgi:hypothetical protein
MSKKTQNIYKAIENLENLKNRLSACASEDSVKEIEEIEFQMGQELKNLKFWIDSLYSYNGKSTSLAKKAASKENGKKGGRPPKAVTEAKRKIVTLEVQIPEIEHRLDMTDSVEERKVLEEELQQKKNELMDLQIGLKMV